jgi:hypothetical protein
MAEKKYNVIELEFEPVYKIPEGYHAVIEGDGRTLMLWKDPWVPQVGEVYYEPMMVQYKPVKKECKGYEDFKGKRVFKTEKECRDWCKWQNGVHKKIYNRLTNKED